MRTRKALGLAIAGLLPAVAGMAAYAIERPYAFRERLLTVHEPDRRDASLAPAADEYVLCDGIAIALPAGADALLRRAAADFVDYLRVSMHVSARGDGTEGDGIGLRLDPSLGEGRYTVDVSAAGGRIAAGDVRSGAQAFYHLEDLMNLRRAPYLRMGHEDRTRLFSPRMTHSGYGCDDFPDAHLNQIAHAGMDAILVFVKDVDKTKGNPGYQDIGDTIRRARRFGLDTYLYSYLRAFAHPRDAGSAEVFENSFGRVSKAYPEAKGFILVGESCEFPSRDPRVIPVEAAKRGREHEGDRRPMAGYFPCEDYPEWLTAVKAAVHRYNPTAEVVFWTYNWGKAPRDARLRLIDRLPRDVSLLVTYEMFEDCQLPNGFKWQCNDYSLAFAGPGEYFASEAERAHRDGITLYAMSNTGGRTWDFGAMPYLPHPYQWRRRWQGMRKAHDEWGLCGLMESHHYGWHPSFIAELAKEAFTRGGMPFDEHLRKLAARDFGAGHVDAVLKVWRDWSEALTLQPATHANQYSVFRSGPAFPFNALMPRIRDPFSSPGAVDPGLPFHDRVPNGARIYRMNYADDQVRQWIEGLNCFPRLDPSAEELKLETEALDRAARLYLDGAAQLRRFAAELADVRRRQNAERLAGMGEFMGRTCLTAVNVKRAAKLENTVLSAAASAAGKTAATDAIHRLAEAERLNARSAMKVLENDSSLGWEATMGYVGGVEQLKWKLEHMERKE